MKLTNSHGGYAGRTLINRIETQMDRQRKKLGDLINLEILESSNDDIPAGRSLGEYNRERGRYEGLAAALAILRSNSVNNEIERSNERLQIK